jgi:hypothetical protein
LHSIEHLSFLSPLSTRIDNRGFLPQGNGHHHFQLECMEEFTIINITTIMTTTPMEMKESLDLGREVPWLLCIIT